MDFFSRTPSFLSIITFLPIDLVVHYLAEYMLASSIILCFLYIIIEGS